MVFGAGVLLVLNLAARLMPRDPESVGLHPDGAPEPPESVAVTRAPWPLRRAARTSTFWLVGAAFGAAWIPVFIPLVHLVRFSQDLGFSPMVGASVISVMGLGSIAGRLVMSLGADRWGRRRTGAAAMVLEGLAFAGFLGTASLGMLYAVALVYGFAYGAISTLFAPIIADFFGREQAGTLVGVLWALAGSTGGSGPVIAGAIHDATGSYALAFALAAALSGLGALLLLLCRSPRRLAAPP